MNLVSAVSDRVLALNYGRPIATGTPDEIKSHPEVVRAYLGG
jgi:branched-chain amino acid transport system ATP-binding protein